MSVRGVAPGRLRRRLAIAFVLIAGVATGALAVGSYLVVRSSRLDDSAQRAVSRFAADTAAEIASSRTVPPAGS